MTKPRATRGFTLIEVMVVIGIIAVLSGIILAAVGPSRAKSRDTANIQAMVQMRNALEIYRQDNGGYPYFGTAGQSACNYIFYQAPGSVVPSYNGALELIPGITSKYISSYPYTLSAVFPRAYMYCSNSKDYYFEGYNVLENPIPETNSFFMPCSYGSITVIEGVHCSNQSAVVYSDAAYVNSQTGGT